MKNEFAGINFIDTYHRRCPRTKRQGGRRRGGGEGALESLGFASCHVTCHVPCVTTAPLHLSPHLRTPRMRQRSRAGGHVRGGEGGSGVDGCPGGGVPRGVLDLIDAWVTAAALAGSWLIY